MTAEQAQLLSRALAGRYEADHDVAAGACLQAADELMVMSEAIPDRHVAGALYAMADRLRAAAKLAGVLELAAEDEAAEARQ